MGEIEQGVTERGGKKTSAFRILGKTQNGRTGGRGGQNQHKKGKNKKKKILTRPPRELQPPYLCQQRIRSGKVRGEKRETFEACAKKKNLGGGLREKAKGPDAKFKVETASQLEGRYKKRTPGEKKGPSHEGQKTGGGKTPWEPTEKG